MRNFQISYLRITNLTCSECQILQYWEYISFLGPNFPGMRGLILALISNVCYLAVILILFGDYLVVTARYLVVTACYLVVTGGYYSLLVVTARYRSSLLVPTFSMNAILAIIISEIIWCNIYVMLGNSWSKGDK